MAKRPLLTAAVFFLTGILLKIYQVNIEGVIVLCLLFLLYALIFYRKHFALCGVMVAFLLLGSIRMDASQERQKEIANHYNSVSRSVTMTVTDFSDNGRAIVKFQDKGKTYKAYLRAKNNVQLYPGDIIQGEVTFSEPLTSKTEKNDFAAYLSSLGVYLNASSDNIHTQGQYTHGTMGKIYTLRRYMNKVGEKYFTKTTRAFYNAMVFGDKRLITDDLSNALQGAGLNHIAVVSGMHLSVIIAALMFIIRAAFGRCRGANAIFAAAALCVMLATGAGASVMRAFAMCVLYQLSQILYRENDPLTSLGFASLTMLMINPCLVYNAGFVLSVLSVLGIFLFSKKLFTAFEPFLPKGANGAISVSIAASLMVTVALSYYFGTITPYAVLSNLLVLTMATVFVVMGILLPVADIFGAGAFIAWVMELLADAMETICRSVSNLPGAIISVEEPDGVFLTVWIFALVMIYKHPVPTRTRLRLAAAFVGILVSAAVLEQGDIPRTTFLTYGGKTMTAVHWDKDEAILVDCHDSYDAASLAENARSPFRWGILTTDDTENMLTTYQNGGMEAVIAPKELFTPEQREELLIEAEEKRLRLIFLSDGQRLSLGRVKVEFFPVMDERRALRLRFGEKTLVTLQGLEGKDIEKLCADKVKIQCDYLKIPFAVLPEGTDLSVLTDGKILDREKNTAIQ